MEDVTHDIYELYHEDFIKKIKEDKFYKYYYNLLETGTIYSKFQNRKLIKDIDEEWVEAIEKALPHIHYVAENPRTFIEDDKQIVNVSIARKFTVESIKHLAQHSEMIDRVKEDGSVEPNRILNVLKEESYNTYENRFINTLIRDLKFFVNERADVILERNKDEDGVLLEVDSNIDNYSEFISYKIEMRIREKQTDMAADEENLNMYSRVSVLHKEINSLACSKFSVIMSDYPLVKHPVVKTNAIAKNVHYKACYDLWNFIRSYNRVGYRVEIIEQDPVINRKFEEDIYHSLLMNFVMLREHMYYKDIINISRGLRDKEVSVASIRQFMEEVVNEYNMPEADLKQLILKEFAKAQREKNLIVNKANNLLDKKKGKEDKKAKIENAVSWDEFVKAATVEDRALKEEQDKSKSSGKLTRREKDKLKKEKNIRKQQEAKRIEQELEKKRKERRLEEQKKNEEEQRRMMAEAKALEEVKSKKTLFGRFRKKDK